jgi:hypothetical protein
MLIQQDAKLPRLEPATMAKHIAWLVNKLTPYTSRTLNVELVKIVTLELLPRFIKIHVPLIDVTNAAIIPARGSLIETLKAYSGQPLTKPLISIIATRLAGNMESIKAGVPVMPFFGLTTSGWQLATIVDAQPHVTNIKKIPGALIYFKVHTGQAAGETIKQFISDGRFRHMLRKLKLLKKKERRMAYPEELVKFKLAIYIEATDPPKIVRFKERASLNKRNEALRDARNLKTRQCPEQFSWSCHFCWKGFNACHLGTHSQDYIIKNCSGGHSGYFKFDDITGYCVLCHARRWKNARS